MWLVPVPDGVVAQGSCCSCLQIAAAGLAQSKTVDQQCGRGSNGRGTQRSRSHGSLRGSPRERSVFERRDRWWVRPATAHWVPESAFDTT